MSKHTPGPWQVYWRAGGVGWPGGIITEHRDYDHERPEVVPGEMWNRCMVLKFGINDFDRLAYVNSDRSVSFATLSEHVANARLIAAAPDLLEAIRPLVELLENFENAAELSEKEVIAAKAAIAKAEGQS